MNKLKINETVRLVKNTVLNQLRFEEFEEYFKLSKYYRKDNYYRVIEFS